MILPEKALLSKTNDVDYYNWNYEFPIKYIQQYRFKTILKLLGDIQYENLLEAGTGSGIFLPELSKHCINLFACDIHPNLENLHHLLSHYKISNYDIQKQSIQRTSYPDNYFDAIVAVSMLEFVDDLEQALNEIKRILKPTGVFVTICPMESKLLDFFVTYYSKRRAEEQFRDSRKHVGKELEKNFQVVEKGYLLPVIGKQFPVYTHFKLMKN